VSAPKRERLTASGVAVLTLTFALTLTARVWGIDRHYWMLEDQIRDWSVALRPFTSLPLVGSPTHVHGYTIGPAFYWILWIIRTTVGPWFGNLPHAGGIGQAMLQSAADTLLLAAVWRRTGSVWLALTTVVAVATAAADLSYSALVWNPMAGAALSKIATAFVLLGWPQRSAAGVAVTAAVAWCAVQSYTGAIFVAVGVFAALLAGSAERRNRRAVVKNAAIVAVVVAVLQVPYAIHQFSNRFNDSGMSAVTGSVQQVLKGEQPLDLGRSWDGYAHAFTEIETAPWRKRWFVWVLVGCAAVVASRFRRDRPLLAVILLPQIAAVLGYAWYVGDFLDYYYYFPLMPAAVLTLTLSITAVRPTAWARAVSVALLIAALALVPARLRLSATLSRMPQYGPLLDGSRALVQLQRPVRAIRTEFALPPTSDPEFIYGILGGRIDRTSAFTGVIAADGRASIK